jgi:hypothetical protein
MGHAGYANYDCQTGPETVTAFTVFGVPLGAQIPCLRPELTILANAMNGASVSVPHGAPL